MNLSFSVPGSNQPRIPYGIYVLCLLSLLLYVTTFIFVFQDLGCSVECLSRWICLMSSHDQTKLMHFLARRPKKWHCILLSASYQGCTMSTDLIIGDVNLYHLNTVVSASFSDCKIIVFLCNWKIAWGKYFETVTFVIFHKLNKLSSYLLEMHNEVFQD